jgi:hypothetical protein
MCTIGDRIQYCDVNQISLMILLFGKLSMCGRSPSQLKKLPDEILMICWKEPVVAEPGKGSSFLSGSYCSGVMERTPRLWKLRCATSGFVSAKADSGKVIGI